MRPTTSPWSDRRCVRPHVSPESTGCIATAPGPCPAIAVAVVCALAACSNAESPPAPAEPAAIAASTPQVQPVASAPALPPDAVAAAPAQGGAEAGRDPFAGVDPTQNDVLRNIARLDPGAATKAAPRPLIPRSVDATATAAPGADTAPPGVTSPVASAVAAPVVAPAGTAANAATSTISPTVAAAADPSERAIGATVSVSASAPGAASAPTTGSIAIAATVPAPVAAATAVTTRRAIAQPAPSFPRDALREGINAGRVVANLAVAADGRVTEVTVISATPSRAFGRVAQQALRDWRYEAAAAPSSVQVELVFRSD